MIQHNGPAGNITASGTIRAARFVGGLSETPSLVADVPTELMGPPTSGIFEEGDIWIDVLYAKFRCTAAGEPGEWVQITPAVVTEPPADPPTNYLVIVPSDKWQQYFYTSVEWVPVYLTPGIY